MNNITKVGTYLVVMALAMILLVGCNLESGGDLATTLSPSVPVTWPVAEKIVKAPKIAVVPHHLLVKMFMGKFYGEMAAVTQPDLIILLAPNHFGYGFSAVQSVEELEGKDLLTAEPYKFKIAGDLVEKLADKGALTIEPKHFFKEHGVYVEGNFISKYFPNALVLPIIVKKETEQSKLDFLEKNLVELVRDQEATGKKVLILGSFDFSHYSSEEFSMENDLRMIGWMGSWGGIKGNREAEASLSGKDSATVEDAESKQVGRNLYNEAMANGVSLDGWDKEAVAVDSAEGVYLLAKLAVDLGVTDFHFWRRTSAASMIKGTSAANNTSHVFGWWD